MLFSQNIDPFRLSTNRRNFSRCVFGDQAMLSNSSVLASLPAATVGSILEKLNHVSRR
jgi:hypothetical protein